MGSLWDANLDNYFDETQKKIDELKRVLDTIEKELEYLSNVDTHYANEQKVKLHETINETCKKITEQECLQII